MEIQTVLETLKEKYINKKVYFFQNRNINDNCVYNSLTEPKESYIESIKCEGLVENVDIEIEIDDCNYFLTINHQGVKKYLYLFKE